MTTSDNLTDISASKTHHEENFPVASILIAPRHRATVLAYYKFARGADDVADSETLSPDDKLARLDLFEATLLGKSDAQPLALPLRAALALTKLSPRHALDLLQAFRMDAVKSRYASWDDLMHYCAYSAAPVGRFVLDVHGEDEATWPASDALCAGLQIINHLQDCAADYCRLDRVYVPQDIMARHGVGVEALTAERASPGLLACLHETAMKNAALCEHGLQLSPLVHDWRLRLETAVIGTVGRRLNQTLCVADPLSQKVHMGKFGFVGWSLVGALSGLVRRRPALIQSPKTGSA